MPKYCRKYILIIFIAWFILMVQFFLALSFYTSNKFEEQFLKEGKFKKNHQLGLKRIASESESNGLISNDAGRAFSPDHLSTSQSSKQHFSSSKLSNIKASHKLNLETLGFKPNCNIILRDAIYAINRAKSVECKKSLADIACLMQANQLFPDHLPQYCPFKEVKKKEPIISDLKYGDESVRIAFLFTFNERSVRQITRLIKSLYSQRHIYFIHIDKRQNYLFNELLFLETLPNVHLSRNRLSTIWGGASLLEMLINSFGELLKYKDWDYLINLSESDFPIKSLQKLESFLTVNNGHNFVKSHGQDTQRFLVKQGLDKTFHQCDDHMWRLGDRKIPQGIEVDGGSDWVALTRDFCKYVVDNDNELLKGLRIFFKYTLLPAETFFHTVLRNSEFCDTIVDNNLHVTNWRRKLGCKCQYRHIVDWCGCSPNDFKLDDWSRIVDSFEKPLFFARKFEPSVNQAIINRVEVLVSKTKGKVSQLGYDKYWQNDFHSKFDQADNGKSSFYYLVGLMAAKQVHTMCLKKDPWYNLEFSDHYKDLQVNQATLFFENDSFMGSLVAFENIPSGHNTSSILEAYASPVPHFILHRHISSDIQLISAKVCSEYDMKEQLFRNHGCILNPFSEIGVNHKWLSDGRSNFSVTFVWVDPAENVAGSFEVKIDWPHQSKQTGMQTLILYHKPSFSHPLRPGSWRLFVLFKWNAITEVQFLILPFILNNGHPLQLKEAKEFHNGPTGRNYLQHNFTAVERLLKLRKDASSLDAQALADSQKIGQHLIDWASQLLSTFWTIRDICLVDRSAPCKGAIFEPCHTTPWSSFSPDLKSKLI